MLYVAFMDELFPLLKSVPDIFIKNSPLLLYQKANPTFKGCDKTHFIYYAIDFNFNPRTREGYDFKIQIHIRL